jgi:hypothetical protein
MHLTSFHSDAAHDITAAMNVAEEMLYALASSNTDSFTFSYIDGKAKYVRKSPQDEWIGWMPISAEFNIAHGQPIVTLAILAEHKRAKRQAARHRKKAKHSAESSKLQSTEESAAQG